MKIVIVGLAFILNAGASFGRAEEISDRTFEAQLDVSEIKTDVMSTAIVPVRVAELQPVTFNISKLRDASSGSLEINMACYKDMVAHGSPPGYSADVCRGTTFECYKDMAAHGTALGYAAEVCKETTFECYKDMVANGTALGYAAQVCKGTTFECYKDMIAHGTASGYAAEVCRGTTFECYKDMVAHGTALGYSADVCRGVNFECYNVIKI